MSNNSAKIYPQDVFKTVNSDVSLTVNSPIDLDLECELQIVNGASAVLFDFSVFALVKSPDDIDDALRQINVEIHAFDALLEAVKKAHSEFLTEAFNATQILKDAPTS